MIMKQFWILFFFVFGVFLANCSIAKTEPTPIGYWRAYDDHGNARSIVQLSVINNTLQGKIVKIIAPKPGDKLNPYCSNCSDQFRNQPLKNLTFVWGLKKKGDRWEGGHILDTDTGHVYRCQISISSDNKTLHVLGYVAAPLFGKTINWERVR